MSQTMIAQEGLVWPEKVLRLVHNKWKKVFTSGEDAKPHSKRVGKILFDLNLDIVLLTRREKTMTTCGRKYHERGGVKENTHKNGTRIFLAARLQQTQILIKAINFLESIARISTR